MLWMADADIAKNVDLFKRTGINVGAEMFTTDVLQEIYHGRTRV